MDNNVPQQPQQTSADAKSDARDDRLMSPRLRKNNEEVLRKKMQEEVKTKCKDFYHALGSCAEKQGLMVIFNCRPENTACKPEIHRSYFNIYLKL